MNSSDFLTNVVEGGVNVGLVKENLDGLELLYHSQEGCNMLYRCQLWGRSHVIKALKPQYRGVDFYEAALFKEFSIGFQLEHPNICKTISWKQLPDLGNCILMEYIDGITLDSFIRQGRLTEKLAVKIINEILDALEYIHNKQVIHRDIKPSNIMITHNGLNAKLIDFSLSDCDDFNILKMPAGTKRYLAPETTHNGVKMDYRADIYSLGVVIEEMAIAVGSGFLKSLSHKCVVKERSRRLFSVKDMRKYLNATPSHNLLRYSIFGITAAVIAVISVSLFTYPAEPDTVMGKPAGYGNVSYGIECRTILAEERARLALMGASEIDPSDSVNVMKRLRDALNREYPAPQQRLTKSYSMIWHSLQMDVVEMYGK